MRLETFQACTARMAKAPVDLKYRLRFELIAAGYVKRVRCR
jgi:hypothetical protein